MSLSAQLTSTQLRVVIEDRTNADKSAWEVHEQLKDGEVVLDPENSSSVLIMVVHTINIEFEHKFHD